MPLTRVLMKLLCLLLPLALAGAAEAQLRPQQKASFVLNLDRTAYDAGAPARVAALVTIEPEWHVNSHQPTFDYLIPTVLTLALPDGWSQAKVHYPQAEMQKFAFADQPLAVYDGDVVIVADLQVPAGTKAGSYAVRGTLGYQACNDSQCLPPVSTEAEVQLTVGPGGQPQHGELFAKPATADEGGIAPPAAGDPAAPRPGSSLAVMLLLAMLGGLVLNVMPCVLPVLSLKLFGLVRSAGHSRSEVTRATLATSTGIVVSFLAMGLVAIVARSAGAAVGWGIQFQRPGFVALLAVVVVLFCLNLWGLFEIRLPQSLARLGATGPREGTAGHFFSGLFATVMATPCSAPFLGTAIGFALAQSAPVILAVFAALGVGMALPYLLVAVAPGLASLLPKPGAWMETVRGIMGFLLAGSAVWLFYVLSLQVSSEQLAATQLGLLGIALFTWMRSRLGAGRLLRGLATAGGVAAIAVTLIAAAGSPGEATQRTAEKPAGLIPWIVFDRARAESLAAGGQLVFVDVTAAWCFTCKMNERLILDTPEVAQAFEEHGVVPMKADWTNRNEEIATFLAEHGRYGIPFYLLYRPGREPHVFSELPSKTGLVSTVREAAGGRPIAQR
jgi:suppressor for copper-sensitivity B